MEKLTKSPYTSSDLEYVDNEIIPLKELADKELASIYGLTGMVYTPYIDAYMQVSIKKAKILACLKNQGTMPLSEVERISSILDSKHSRAKHNDIVEYNKKKYKRKLSPLKLSKSGKVVQKWARFWLLQTSEERAEPSWEKEVREIWPTYFLIRTIDI